MEYEVEREQNQYHVRERGQMTRGTTLTDGWLKQMGFWPLSRLNIDAAIKATMASARGTVLDPYAARRVPSEIGFKAGFKSYPSAGRGTKPRNTEPAQSRPRIPERMLFKA